MFARLLSLALGVLALLSFVAADEVEGTATFTGGNLSGGACLYYNYTLPKGIYGTAIDLNNTPYQCGTCLKVIGSQGSIVVMVLSLLVQKRLPIVSQHQRHLRLLLLLSFAMFLVSLADKNFRSPR
jgi:hypothetical protein